MKSSSKDRRRHARVVLARPCKVFHHATRRFLPARTLDVSVGGSLMTVDSPRAFEPGEPLDLFINWTDEAVIPAEAMVAARVVRTHGSDGLCQTVGIRFEAPLELADAA